MQSDQISKTLFHFPKLADAQPQEKGGDFETEPETGPIELAGTPPPARCPPLAPLVPISRANAKIPGYYVLDFRIIGRIDV